MHWATRHSLLNRLHCSFYELTVTFKGTLRWWVLLETLSTGLICKLNLNSFLLKLVRCSSSLSLCSYVSIFLPFYSFPPLFHPQSNWCLVTFSTIFSSYCSQGDFAPTSDMALPSFLEEIVLCLVLITSPLPLNNQVSRKEWIFP